MFGFEYDEKAARTGICPGIGQLERSQPPTLPTLFLLLASLSARHSARDTCACPDPPGDNSNAAWFLSYAEHILNLLFERCRVCNRNVWRLNAR